MPCAFPIQATFKLRSDGKKDIQFSTANAKAFAVGRKPLGDNNISLPCGRCMPCRLEKSRQWAVRCLHESKCYDQNCFVTLTYSSEFLPEDKSLNRKHIQDFLKRVRFHFNDRKIKVFYCGEYGDKLDRPHYHICFFNLDFPDKEKEFKHNGNWNYSSQVLTRLWPFGISIVTDFSFETAAYVARYCTKKVTGKMAEDHYQGRLPEFAGMSLKPGIGSTWFEKYADTDLIPQNNVVVRGVQCKPPRYYDILWERKDPVSFAKAKEERKELADEMADDNSAHRLAQKLKCLESRTKLLFRRYENG